MKPQKALHLHIEEDKARPKYAGHSYCVFRKYDGWYGYKDGDGFINSRQCRPIPSLFEFSVDIPTIFCGRLIFEIMIDGVEEFHIMNGILNRSVGDCQAKNVYLMVHDYIPLGGSQVKFYDRYVMAQDIVHAIGDERIRISPILAITPKIDTWKMLANQVWEDGGEGIVLKRHDAPYSYDKRNADLMKIKEELTFDFIVTGMEKGEGKYSDTLGSLIVEGKNGIKHMVSGMTDAQRNEWWDNPAEILGKLVEIKAMKILPDGTLREPRFKAIRYDKADID